MEDIFHDLKLTFDSCLYKHGMSTNMILTKILSESRFYQSRRQVKDIGYHNLFKAVPIPEFSISSGERPDVGIFWTDQTLTDLQNLCFTCEEDSTKSDNYIYSIFRACHYSRTLCRLSSMAGIDPPQRGVCLVFPSAHPDVSGKPLSVVEVSCSWNYQKFCFEFSAESIKRHNLQTHISKLFALRNVGHSVNVDSLQKYVYKLIPSQITGTGLQFQHNPFEFKHQCLSAKAIVMKVVYQGESKVIKVVKDIQRILMLKPSLKSSYVLHYEEIDFFSIPFKVLYEECISPLDPISARSCLVDFIEKLKLVFDDIHESSFQHCDIRLENICFRLGSDGTGYDIVLIDLEFVQQTSEWNWKDTLRPLSDKSCMYRGIYQEAFVNVDFKQLGYMIQWICNFGKTIDITLNGKESKFTFSSNDSYHNMDKVDCTDEFIRKLINEGK